MDITFRVRSITNGLILTSVGRPTPSDPLAQRGPQGGEEYHPNERSVSETIERVLTEEAQREAGEINNPR